MHGVFVFCDELQSYIVYMGDLPETKVSVAEEHHRLLVKAIGDESIARKSKIHSYGRSFNGFAAKLLPHEVKILLEEENVVSVFANTKNKLHTTRSWDFLGMKETISRRPKSESSIIVGMMDTGIYVKSPSFDDQGYGPAPHKWRGKCVIGSNFTGCNNKVIGAKYYNLDNMDPGMQEDQSPADDDGHGTHTASTVAGVAVRGASLFGIANGTARGGVPAARIAMYKVCWGGGCTDLDLLAAFDDAIADGVDLISVSIGGNPRNYFEDPIAIGSFHAMKKGILTSCSAGNEGPTPSTVQNVAPWIMTVGASSIDRQFKTQVKLGNGMKASGITINTFSPKKKMYPLTSGALASNLTGNYYGNASACDYGTLSMEKVKGRIVYCRGDSGQDYTIRKLKGAGVITSTSAETDIAFTTLIPATNVDLKEGHKIDRYINKTKNPRAVIHRTRTVKIAAPVLASFSSRGPQLLTLNILKPDLAAPGIDILAAYSRLVTVTGESTDKRFSNFNIISGTSMSCPHASAAAAYVKSFHPDWSPAAIKSALMTTATHFKIKSDELSELGSGSGQINPGEAVHPGLVYDNKMSSYLRFLCKEGYNSTTIGLLVGGKNKYNCSNFKPAKGIDGLNYPSMHAQVKTSSSPISAVFYRTVTQVGYGKSVYKATVISPKHLSIKVVPETLTFSRLHERKNFKVIVKGGPMPSGKEMMSAWLEWNDSEHSVKSPIVICKTFYF
ncbi:subtilisin-like protease SBT4.15 [Manihot esculenta]|uniref:subtilisin-like protease SBT4.15 n=1 Tax=Manihot esculenta TaxID=3983 RepID=UPI001CC7AA4E|nr:subtilisin-like protease SBT4.15 [Manihot esculenta]